MTSHFWPLDVLPGEEQPEFSQSVTWRSTARSVAKVHTNELTCLFFTHIFRTDVPIG